jgi:zinc transporter 9
MSLSHPQLRIISTVGMGILVGTSLVVIVPEGVEAIYSARPNIMPHGASSVMDRRAQIYSIPESTSLRRRDAIAIKNTQPQIDSVNTVDPVKTDLPILGGETGSPPDSGPPKLPTSHDNHGQLAKSQQPSPPTFYIGLALILGFVLMFLIDRVPRHASDNFSSAAPPRQFSLSTFSQGLHSTGVPDAASTSDSESMGFLSALALPRSATRSLATTTGLIIHAAADGVAMGATASSANSSLGFVVFLAILIHKAPAAFGLTSVLLKYGLSKRAARAHLIVFSLAAPVGALCTFLLVHMVGGGGGPHGEWWTGMLLLFSAGTFL